MVERHQEIEALPALVIPEFGAPDAGPVLHQCRMLTIAAIRHMQTASKRQQAHLLLTSERVVMPVHIAERRGDRAGRFVQALEALFGIAQPLCLRILLGFSPEGSLGGADLSEDTARHLGRHAIGGRYLGVEVAVQPLAVGGLAMRESMQTGLVQRVTKRQLGVTQGGELFRREQEFQFGGDGGLHAPPFFFSTMQTERRCGASSHVRSTWVSAPSDA